MKNTKSLNELLAIAAVSFQHENNNGVNIMYASEDGFTFNDENRARIHCKSIPDLKYHPITRTEALKNVIIVDDLDENPDPDKGKVSEELTTQKVLTDGSTYPGELEDLKAKYEELFGKAAHHNIGVEKLKTLIAEKIAESNDQDLSGDDDNPQQSA